MDNFDPLFIRWLYEDRKLTIAELHDRIKQELRARGINDQRGFSVGSLRRFMKKHDIGQHWLRDDQVDEMVEDTICLVGPMVGAKMMAGQLRNGFHATVGRNRLSRSMRRVDPAAAALRDRRMHNLVNPQTYHGRYFGYNLHMDQNEKLVMFDVTFVIAVDGHSGMIVGSAVMSKKNNIVIYDDVYKKICQTYGMWDRILVDHGKEFFLALYMHQKFHLQMGYVNREDLTNTYRQMRSVRNNRVERLWVEINRCASYPIKACVAEMYRDGVLDVASDLHTFCIGAVIRPIVSFAFDNTIKMWNEHVVPGRGRPSDYVQSSRTKAIQLNLLVNGDQAADEYRRTGGRLTDEIGPSGDILEPYPDLREQRDRLFWEVELPSLGREILLGRMGHLPAAFIRAFARKSVIELLFGATSNRIYRPLEEAILLHVSITVALYNRSVD